MVGFIEIWHERCYKNHPKSSGYTRYTCSLNQGYGANETVYEGANRGWRERERFNMVGGF